MPGDRIDIGGYNYYTDPQDPGQTIAGNNDIADALLTALAGGVNVNGIPINELTDNMATLQSTVGSTALPTLLDALETNNYDPQLPASGLVWVVFNQAMEPMEDLSGMVQASGADDWAHADAPTIDIQEPGYILIFAKSTSNKSVYWNNLKVSVLQGVTLEENHYYPFGLTLSQNSANPAEHNTLKYQGIELERKLGLEIYETFYRGLDPQLGRFNQIDPKAELDHAVSPFASMRNNPIVNIDPLGDLPSTHTDGMGNVVAVYNDGNLGIYKHTELEINSGDLKNNTKQLVGSTLYENSFAIGDKIDFGSFRARETVEAFESNMRQLVWQLPAFAERGWYGINARNGGALDPKSYMKGGIGGGSQISSGVYVSNRDLGNYMAGAFGRISGMGKRDMMVEYGAFNLASGSGIAKLQNFVENRENLKFKALNNRDKLTPLYGSENQKTYGEDPGSNWFIRLGYEGINTMQKFNSGFSKITYDGK